jgi:hypothetical protein
MAKFYGGVQGHRGEATRLGSLKSGIRAFAQSWTLGARVYVWHGPDGEDRVTVTLTGGSYGAVPDKELGTWQRDDKGGFKRVGDETDETGEVQAGSQAAA